MKSIGIFLVFLISCLTSLGQTFYEIEWEADRLYTALVIYYDDSQIDVRVQYDDDDGIFHVAKYSCIGTEEMDDEGYFHFIFDGYDAEVIYSSEPSNATYVADNFFFTDLSEDYVFENLYTIDDEGLEQEDITDELIRASFFELDPLRDFTEEYIGSFFFEDEPEYELFLGITKPQAPPLPVQPPAGSSKAVMHLVIAADTKDRSIGPSTKQDMDEVTATFTKIARELGIEIQEYRLLDQQFSKQELVNRLNGINVGSNDILVYYYSGHGYNDTEASSTFPTMALDGPDYALEDLYQQAKGRNARLTLVIGDLCNSIPETRQGVGRREALPFKSGYLFDTGKLQTLFLKSRGSVLSTSSRKGEWSFCMNNPDGTLGAGHFTHAFLESIIKESSKVSDGTGDWSVLLNRAWQKANAATNDIVNQDGKKGQTGLGVINVSR